MKDFAEKCSGLTFFLRIKHDMTEVENIFAMSCKVFIMIHSLSNENVVFVLNFEK